MLHTVGSARCSFLPPRCALPSNPPEEKQDRAETLHHACEQRVELARDQAQALMEQTRIQARPVVSQRKGKKRGKEHLD